MPKLVYDWVLVQVYHDEGHGFVECAKRFGFCPTAWIKAVKRGALKVAPSRFRDRRRKYDWSEVQAYYDGGHTYRQTAAHFGFCSEAWFKAIKRGEIVTRAPGMPIAQLLSSTKRNRHHVKTRLLKAPLAESLPSVRSRRVVGTTAQHAPRSRQRRQERPPPHKPSDALSQLPQPNADLRRPECQATPVARARGVRVVYFVASIPG